MSSKHKDTFFSDRREPWLTRYLNRFSFWFWLRRMDVHELIKARAEFRAGQRAVERHVLDDLEFGYTADMIASKVAAHNYSYPEADPRLRATDQAVAAAELAVADVRRTLDRLYYPGKGPDLEVTADLSTPEGVWQAVRARLHATLAFQEPVLPFVQLVVLDRATQARLLDYFTQYKAAHPEGYLARARSYVTTDEATNNTRRWVETPLGDFELLVDEHAAPGTRLDFY